MFGTTQGMRSGYNPLAANAANYGRDAIGAAQQRAGENLNLSADPGVQASMDAFNVQMRPQIENAMAGAGLARSGAAGRAVADAMVGAMQPAMESALQREQQSIGNEIAANQGQAGLLGQLAAQRTQQQLGALGIESQAAGQLAGIGNQFDARKQWAQQALMQAGQNQMALGGQIDTRNMNMMNQMMGIGGQFRDIAQQANQAQYQDFLRRQGLAEQSLLAPMGILQGSLGSTTSTGGGK
jgi:hypothetical protein